MNLKSFADPLLVPDDKAADKSVFRPAAETPKTQRRLHQVAAATAPRILQDHRV